MQPNLFFETETEPYDEKANREAGKSIVKKLLTIRQQLEAQDNRAFIHLLNDAINAIRAESNYSEMQREQFVFIFD